MRCTTHSYHRQRATSCGMLILVARPQPGRDGRLVGAQFFIAEAEGDFALSGVGAVGAVDEIHLAAGAVVAADGPGIGLRPSWPRRVGRQRRADGLMERRD